ncbi:TPA: hypothetical protein ACPZR0_002858 [Yersinia enterocolitica]
MTADRTPRRKGAADKRREEKRREEKRREEKRREEKRREEKRREAYKVTDRTKEPVSDNSKNAPGRHPVHPVRLRLCTV